MNGITNQWGICALCGVPFKTENERVTRKSWIRAGGTGVPPTEALAHYECDRTEIRRINFGQIKLNEVWVNRAKPDIQPVSESEPDTESGETLPW